MIFLETLCELQNLLYYPSVFKCAIAYSRILSGGQSVLRFYFLQPPFPSIEKQDISPFLACPVFPMCSVFTGIVVVERAGQVGGATSR